MYNKVKYRSERPKNDMEYQKETKNTDLAAYLFHQGTNFRSQDYLGVHLEGSSCVFRVWAPGASGACVIGSFNDWNSQDPAKRTPMTCLTEGGVWEARVPASLVGEKTLYKFMLQTPNGVRYKADPYARRTAPAPETASLYRLEEDYVWQDAGWLSWRRRTVAPQKSKDRPINVYELHLGSFRRHEDGRCFTYEEMARELIPYIKQMGYTHIQLMPVMEHPDDASGGYAATSYYAPTSRFGTPRDFMAFVDAMHGAGVGVFLDLIPADPSRVDYGLCDFDGTPLYEGREVGSLRPFAVGRREVDCFLISCVAFWAETYHIDGFRIGAVAPLLQRDPDKAAAFFRKLNTMMNTRFPDVLTIAEAVGEREDLTTSGGLGFSMKWNLGWTSDVLTYHATDPSRRERYHRHLTFSLMYSFREKYMLPISHSEVSGGRGSLLDRMPGSESEKFAGCRALLGYMMTHPGKKLLFMGCEIGRRGEWTPQKGLAWSLLGESRHAALQQYVAELNHLYLETPPLYEIDDSWEGFRWIDADNARQSVLSYRRIDSRGREVVVIINFLPCSYETYSVGVPDAGVYEEIFNSDALRFGGTGMTNPQPIRTRPERLHGLPDTLSFRLPALSMAVFHCRRKQPRVK